MVDRKYMRAPFPYFGGKSSIAGEVWGRLGSPKQYIAARHGELFVMGA